MIFFLQLSFKKTHQNQPPPPHPLLIFNYMKALKMNFQVDIRVTYEKLTVEKELKKHETFHPGASRRCRN